MTYPTPLDDRATARFWAKVDKSGDCWEWTASRWPVGYGRFVVASRITASAHRIAYEICVGPIPEGWLIDHKCFNRGCVNPAHLRLATYKQNAENKSGRRSDNTSGVSGVYWKKNKWAAAVGHNGARIHLGVFETIAEAEAAVVAKRCELFTHNDLDRVP